MRKRASFTRALVVLALVAATIQAQARSSWKIDPSQTHVRFWVDAIGWPRTTGEFKSFEGRIDIDFDRPSRPASCLIREACMGSAHVIGRAANRAFE
jgi:polyisoprenoid-binding protein YceI